MQKELLLGTFGNGHRTALQKASYNSKMKFIIKRLWSIWRLAALILGSLVILGWLINRFGS